MARIKKTEPIKARTSAEVICESVRDDIRPQAITLTNAVLAMQKKIEKEIPDYMEQPLSQTVTVGTGETMLRANPATQEFRATVRDYAQALNNLKEILDEKKTGSTISAVDELKSRFKVG